MRLEHIPLIIGAIVALIGLGFIADASMAASAPVTPERRRRTRTEPSRAGEAVVGVGTLCMAAALFGRDTWRYGTVVVLIGSALLLLGAILNRAFLKEALMFRGAARRAVGGSAAGAGKTGRPARVASKPPSGKPAPSLRAPATAPSRPPAAPVAIRGTAATGSAPATPVRHPTPPLASPAYRPPEVAAPRPASPPATPPAAAASPPARPRPADPAPPASPPPSPGSKERRKTRRGKK